MTAVRRIADHARDLVSNARARRRASGVCSPDAGAREQLDRLDARFEALRARSNDEIPALISGTRVLLASARACTSCDPVVARQCERFDGELAELRRSIDH